MSSTPPPPPLTPPPAGPPVIQDGAALVPSGVGPDSAAGNLGSQSAEQTSLVLRRAMELADLSDPGIDVELPAHTLIEIAQELDIPLDAVAGALVESRLDIDADSRSLIDRLIGPADVWATRVTGGGDSDAGLQDRLIEWLEKGHGLKARARHDGVLVAKKRRGLVGKVGKTVRGARGTGGLAKAGPVEAVVVDLSDDASGSIGLSVDVAGKRTGAIVAGSALALGGSAVVSVVSLVTVPATLAAIPVFAGLGLLTSRRLHGSTVEHMTDAVEETIDGVVTKTEPPGLLSSLRKRSS